MNRLLSTTTLTLALALTAPMLPAQDFIRGDCSNDGAVNITDSFWMLAYIFIPGVPAFPCLNACDANDDGAFGLLDPLYLLNLLHVQGSPPLPPPYPACGSDPTPGFLPCDAYNCTPLPPPTPDRDYLLTLDDFTGLTGSQAEISVMLDSSAGSELSGWSIGVCHDSPVVEVLTLEPGASILEVNDGEPPAFLETAIYPGEGWTAGVVISFFLAEYLLPAADLELHRATYSLVSAGEANLNFCDVLGDPDLQTVLVANGSGVIPVTTGATIGVQDLGFMRGDANGDGMFNGLQDGITVLGFGFIPGSPAPPCLDAADADDNNNVNALVDGLFIFNYQFVPGSPEPPPPGPILCGVDPTPDGLDCEFPACP